jgi:CubicO group peptidase (beta-lactamase class C family)
MLNAAKWTARLSELASQTHVTGATLGIWFDGQEVLAAHGVLNDATQVPVTADSLFQVGSITKIWTTTMIMQLIEEGLLSLDTTVADALPGIRLGTADVGGQVTIRHLLTHTSGIDGDIFTDTGRGDDCVKRYVSELAGALSTFPVGAAYSYCNSGFVLLGRIIEVLRGRSWDESLRDRLTGPLALTHTVTLPEEAILHRAAVGHDGEGVPVQVWSLPRSIGPAGLIISTASDLLTFARLHLVGGIVPDGKRILSAASVSAMQQPRAAIPEFAAPGAAIGLGWRLGRWGDRTIVGHDGDTVGQSAYLRLDPKAQVAACLLTNATESESLFRELFNEVFGSLVGVTMPDIPGPARFAGPPDSIARSAEPAENLGTLGTQNSVGTQGSTGTQGSVATSGSLTAAAELDLERHVGRYERTSRRFDVSVRDGRLHMLLTMSGKLADLIKSRPQKLILYPADSSGNRFVLRSHADQPWVPLSFGHLPDQTPYLYLGGRVTPRVG